MAAIITQAGERLIAEKQAAHEVLQVSRFVLALVPGLDPSKPIDREAPKPPPEQIVHTQIYTQKGFVNPNQVVYSLMMGSDIGDFDWNWIGLESGEGVLLAVGYVPVQQKRKNLPPHQIGNNVTRNMLLVFDGAQALTDVTIDASTWQHDFTVRLRDIDERERLTNRDVFGRACFFGDSLELVKVEEVYQLKPGLVYVEGLRIESADALPLTRPKLPTKAYMDVALVRQENSVAVQWFVAWGENLTDYRDATSLQHYLIPLAHLPDAMTVTDLRETEPITGPLVQQFALRNGDYKELRARATTKEDVDLGNVPNAVSDDPETNSSEILASTAALNRLNQQISDALVGMVAAFDRETAPPGWLERNGADVSRTTYAKLFAVIGTRYGAGDGRTTFNVGDSRGVFIRGLDDGRGLDPDRQLGSLQQGQNASHTHTASAASAGTHSHTGSALSAGSHAHTVPSASHNVYTGYGEQPTSGGISSVSSAAAGDHNHSLQIEPAPDHQHTITVERSGGVEARPINQALLICIKY